MGDVSPGGSEYLNHEPRERGFELALGDELLIGEVSAHMEEHLGEVSNVYHEVISDLVHIDVHFIEPAEGRPWYTLFTTGMSERPMTFPPQFAGMPKHAELMLRLEPSWPVHEIGGESTPEWAYWPIRGLKQLARFPHEYETALGVGHTVPNGDPPEPFASNTELCCWLLTPPMVASPNFAEFEAAGRRIQVLQLMPIYEDEMNLKLQKGVDALVRRFAKAKTPDVISPRRPSAARRRLLGLF
jgi:hypothetical protein